MSRPSQSDAASSGAATAPRFGCRIAVLGAGSWGTALAMQLARNGHRVRLWGRDPEQMETMAEARENPAYLPGIPFPERLHPAADLDALCRDCERLLIATPSHAFADITQRVADTPAAASGITWASKGFEPGSGRFLHQVAEETLGPDTPLALLTGPSFAGEVARGLPTAVTVAATAEDYAEDIAALFHGGSFRAYSSSDLIGAELGGALKNVLAVATGIADGMELGDNARAALITRGLAEMMRLGDALGADPRTLTGLAGMGDLVLTCTGDQSRNRRLGLALGRGRSSEAALADIGQVVEGVNTAVEAMRLARRHQVEMPICEQVHGILHQDWDPRIGVGKLLSRSQKSELE